jgi:ABC-type antimicrobial peptide transport system permease subunit
MLRSYFAIAFRNLFRNKVNTVINVTGLAASIACCLFIYVLVHHENSFDSFHSKAHRIYRVVTDNKGTKGDWHAGYVTFALAKALRNDFPQLETVTQVYTNNSAVVQIPTPGKGRKLFEENEMTYADAGFLKTFDYELLAGSPTGLLTHPDEVVLTRQLSIRYFGKEYASRYNELIGKTILVNGATYRVSGILNDVPRNTNVAFRMLLPFQVFEKQNQNVMDSWENTYSESYVFVTLPENVSAQGIDKALIPFKHKYLKSETASRQTFRLQPLTQVHTDETYGGTFYATPRILIIAFLTMGIIVLLTACINFINLATAQSVKRAKEIGIRKTLGGRQWQLVLQFMSETFLLILLASGVAILLARQFIDVFNQYLYAAIGLDLGLHLDNTVIYFMVGLGLLITLFAGYYPAKVMAGFAPIQALKQTITSRNTGFAGGFSLRKILVVTQFTVSQMLIIGTIVVATQMRLFRTQDLGYTKEGILTIPVPENDAQKLAVFRNQVIGLAGVENVSFSSGPPTSASNSFGAFRPLASPESDNLDIERKFADPHYLPTYNIPLLAGRNLRDDDRIQLKDSANRYNILLNQKAVRALGYQEPAQALGQTILVNNQDQATIVGVVDDFFNVTLQREIQPCLLFYGTNWVAMASVRLKTNTNASTLLAIQKSWESRFPDQIYKAMGLEDYFRSRAFYVMEDIMYQAFKIFAGLSILIGCLGLYGLVSFLALQRQKEIGIRKVLGASVSGIVYLFSKEFVWLVLLAFLLAAPLGFIAMKSWLETFAHRIDLHAGYFALAFVLSMLIAGITVSFQAIKAAMANPVKSLRTE